jgi:hypothetical protein
MRERERDEKDCTFEIHRKEIRRRNERNMMRKAGCLKEEGSSKFQRAHDIYLSVLPTNTWSHSIDKQRNFHLGDNFARFQHEEVPFFLRFLIPQSGFRIMHDWIQFSCLLPLRVLHC